MCCSFSAVRVAQDPASGVCQAVTSNRASVPPWPPGNVGIHDALIRNRDGVLTAHYVIAVHAARYVSGEPVAATDAADARFVALADLASYQLTEGALDLIIRAQRLLRSRDNA
jgi:hypothetical protein